MELKPRALQHQQQITLKQRKRLLRRPPPLVPAAKSVAAATPTSLAVRKAVGRFRELAFLLEILKESLLLLLSGGRAVRCGAAAVQALLRRPLHLSQHGVHRVLPRHHSAGGLCVWHVPPAGVVGLRAPTVAARRVRRPDRDQRLRLPAGPGGGVRAPHRPAKRVALLRGVARSRSGTRAFDAAVRAVLEHRMHFVIRPQEDLAITLMLVDLLQNDSQTHAALIDARMGGK